MQRPRGYNPNTTAQITEELNLNYDLTWGDDLLGHAINREMCKEYEAGYPRNGLFYLTKLFRFDIIYIIILECGNELILSRCQLTSVK